MNILIQQTKAFPHRANSFYWFYVQLTEWLTAHGVDSKLLGQLHIEPIKAIGTMRKCFGLLDQDVHDLFQEFFPDKLYTFKKDHRFADTHDEHIKAYGYSYFKNQQYI